MLPSPALIYFKFNGTQRDSTKELEGWDEVMDQQEKYKCTLHYTVVV